MKPTIAGPSPRLQRTGVGSEQSYTVVAPANPLRA